MTISSHPAPTPVRIEHHPACGHLIAAGQPCHRCALDGHTAQLTRIFDWPPGGVVLDDTDRSRLQAGMTITRLGTGALTYLTRGADMAEVVEPAGDDRAYRVVAADGRYPTWWPSAAQAKRIVSVRQLLRRLPREGGRHWIARAISGASHGQVGVNGAVFADFGYSVNAAKTVAAHRASWLAFHGRLPNGGTVDHLCKRRRCANPDCLAEATWAENQAREIPGAGYGVQRSWAQPADTDPPRRRSRRGGHSSGPAAASGDMASALAALRAKFEGPR